MTRESRRPQPLNALLQAALATPNLVLGVPADGESFGSALHEIDSSYHSYHREKPSVDDGRDFGYARGFTEATARIRGALDSFATIKLAGKDATPERDELRNALLANIEDSHADDAGNKQRQALRQEKLSKLDEHVSAIEAAMTTALQESKAATRKGSGQKRL